MCQKKERKRLLKESEREIKRKNVRKKKRKKWRRKKEKKRKFLNEIIQEDFSNRNKEENLKSCDVKIETLWTLPEIDVRNLHLLSRGGNFIKKKNQFYF